MDKIKLSSFIQPFFQKTLGFWAVILLVGGVLMEFKQHLQIARFLINHPVLFVPLGIGFFLFTWIHLRIQLDLIRNPTYLVFHHFGLFKKDEFLSFWASTILINHSPLLAYLAFMMLIGWEQANLAPTWILGSLYLMGLVFTLEKIRKTFQNPLQESVILRPRFRNPIPRFSWILFHLRDQRPILLLLSKFLGILLLNGFFYSYQSGGYDLRWLQFGILCTAFTHFFLLLEKSIFEQNTQSWILALPIPLIPKFAYHLGNFLIILFPELLFLVWRSSTLSIIEVMSLCIYLISLVAGLYTLIIRKSASPTFHIWIIGYFFSAFLLALFGTSSIILSCFIGLIFFLNLQKPFQF